MLKRHQYISSRLLPTLITKYWILCLIFIFSLSFTQTLGDLNQDESVDVLDIIRTVNIILEVPPEPSDYEIWAGDVNVDYETNVLDVVLMVSYILDIIECPYLNFPCSYNYSQCCLDTTSHEITWAEVDTVGDPFNTGISCAIINENNMLFNGYFDSIGTSFMSNLYKWDGSSWINIDTSSSPYHIGESLDILVFNENDIWIAPGTPKHWDGVAWSTYHLWEMGVLEEGEGPIFGEIWGSAPDDVFFVGMNGTIVHWDGESFIKMGGNTDLWLNTITGTDPNNVWVTGQSDNYQNHILLHFNGIEWNIIYEGIPSLTIIPDTISGFTYGVYTDDPDSVWVVTHLGLYRCPVDTQGEGYLIPASAYVWEVEPNDVNSISRNDVWLACDLQRIWHYNGSTFYYYNNFEPNGNINFESIALKDNLVLSVGTTYPLPHYSVAVRGYR